MRPLSVHGSAAALLWLFVVPTIDGIGPTTSTDDLRAAYVRIRPLLERGAAAEALSVAEAFRRAAKDAGDRQYELLFTMGMVNAQSALQNTQAALALAQQARQMALELAQPDSVAAVAVVLGDVYTRLGQPAAAALVLDEALQPGSRVSPRVRCRLFTLLAELHFQNGDKQRALTEFGSAIAEADRGEDNSAIADVWDRLGLRLLKSGDNAGADIALIEAFRLRRMNRDEGLDISLRNLGMLRLEDGDPGTANALLTRAVQLIEGGHSRVPARSVYHQRALARRAIGDFAGAMSDFAKTFALARQFRADLIPLDEVQSAVDVRFRRFYSDYVETGMQLYASRPSSSLAAEMFILSEENRASGLRQQASWREALPPRYWDVLAQLRSASAAKVARPSPAAAARVRELSGQLTRIEASIGFRTSAAPQLALSPRTALAAIQRSLREDEALISFHIGERTSYVWAVTGTDLEVHSLADRERLRLAVSRFRDGVLDSRPADESESLFAGLFGKLSAQVRSRTHWILVPDDVLFEIPFAALREGNAFAVERRSIRLLPSAFMLGSAAASRSKGFVGYGDAVYNRADPRFRHSGQQRSDDATLELARLPGSATEVRECARVWKDAPSLLLLGADRGQLEAALSRRPALLHLAAHVVASADAQQVLIALGLDRQGRPDFLAPLEISRKRYGVPLVVLSGCSSGRAQVLPGAGLGGLTRAWLLGGSQAVMASHWATTDDTGDLFRAFYRFLRESDVMLSARASATALRLAQLEMLRSGSWRAKPRQWGAYFVAGRD
jgi:CHAT domain-containing protein